MAGIFISYRHDQSAAQTGRLVDDLREQFPTEQVVGGIEQGTESVEAIEAAVSRCSVLLPVIGPDWADARDPLGERSLDNPHDPVRLEIAAALSHGVQVVPVLVGGAPMPGVSGLPAPLKPLARRPTHELSDKRWAYDAELLFARLERIPGLPPRTAPRIDVPPLPPPRRSRMSLIAKLALGAAVVVGGLVALTGWVREQSQRTIAAQPQAAPTPQAGALPPAALQPIAGLPSGSVSALTTEPSLTSQRAVATLPGLGGRPAPVDAASPAAAATPTPMVTKPLRPMDIGGSWLSQRGEMFVIEQEGTTVRLLSQDFTGQQLVTGQGALEGSELDAALVDLASGRAAQLHITVSPDGQTMSGSAVEQATGNRQEIQLVRQE